MTIVARMRTNEQIRVPKVRVIDQTGNQLGIVPTREALDLARDAGLDLVEVAPKENPPVCKILDYGKWRYQQQKQEHQTRKKQHAQELKELRLRPKTDRHDLEIKLNRARQFLEAGSKVQFTMIFRGRERLHQQIGRDIFQRIFEQLEDNAKMEREARSEGRRMIMVLAPKAAQSAGSKPKPKPVSKPAEVEPAKAAESPPVSAPQAEPEPVVKPAEVEPAKAAESPPVSAPRAEDNRSEESVDA